MSEEKKVKIYVVYYCQRWDEVNLLKGFRSKEHAQIVCKELNDNTTVYDDTYNIEEIEIN